MRENDVPQKILRINVLAHAAIFQLRLNGKEGMAELEVWKILLTQCSSWNGDLWVNSTANIKS